MNTDEIKQDLQSLIEETTAAIGGTDQTYIGFVRLMQKAQQLSIPNRLMPGQMVFFKYRPISESFISRNTYYDRFPLVLITDVYRGGFDGVNVHFVDEVNRKFLFDSIMRELPTIKAAEEWRTRLMVNYDRLAAKRKFIYFKPCYRKYKWKGMERRPAIVPFELWEDMVASNTSRFITAKQTTVYTESRRKVLKGLR
jgi:hypothetical protein